MKSSVLVVLATQLLLLGCGASVSQLKSRAAFDLQCQESQIVIVDIDSRTKGVRGCDKQATYIESCATENRMNCTWVLNSDSQK